MNDLKKEILERAAALAPQFKTVLARSSGFEIKGILHSEMLFFVTLIDLLEADRVMESGRARAQSTEIIARWLVEAAPGTRFDSIEFDSGSDDVEVAGRRLEAIDYPVNALFGDAVKLLPGLMKESAGKIVVLIDGPKGIDAARLALSALANEKVVAVCVHDVHKDDTALRAALKLWPRFFASDDEQFVESFSGLDGPCWEEHQKYEAFRQWGPYRRVGRVMESYGPTLVCLVNDVDVSERRQATEQIRKALVSIRRRRDFLRLASRLAPRAIKRNDWLRKLVLRVVGG